jgi:hypothetical protein
MLWPGGFLSLDLATSTPDALCPPLEEARAAVEARVGEVRGEYHAEFALIRSDDGQPALRLSLRDGAAEVLRRELPIDGAGCQDAAQAIALVLERYFDAIEAPTTHPSAPMLESVPVSVLSPRPQRDEPIEPREPENHDLGLQLGALYDVELGAAATLGASFYPQTWRFRPDLRWGIGLQLAPFLSRQHEAVRDGQIEAFSLQSSLSGQLVWQPSWWSVSVGPWAQLRLQRAEASELERARVAYRAVPGLGALAQLGVRGSRWWSLSIGLAGGAQLRSAASSFVLKRDAGSFAVLVPEPWFGQAVLTFELRL